MASYPCRLQIVYLVPRTIAGPEMLFQSSIQNSDEWSVLELVSNIANKGYKVMDLVMKDGTQSWVAYDHFMGWRILLTDIKVV